jgi:hypothetical protein
MAPPKRFSLIIPQYRAAALTPGFSYAQFIESFFKANKRQLKHVSRGVLWRDRRCLPHGWQGRGKRSTARETRKQRHVCRGLIVNLNA